MSYPSLDDPSGVDEVAVMEPERVSRETVRGRLSRSWRSLSRSLSNVSRNGQSSAAERVAARKATSSSNTSNPVPAEGENCPPHSTVTTLALAEASVSANASRLDSSDAPTTRRRGRSRGRSSSMAPTQAETTYVATDQPPRTRSSSASRLRRSLSRSLNTLRDRARQARSRSAGRSAARSSDIIGDEDMTVNGHGVRVRERSPSPGFRVPPLPTTAGGLRQQALVSPRNARDASIGCAGEGDLGSASFGDNLQAMIASHQGSAIGHGRREQELGPLPLGWDMCVDDDGNEYFVKYVVEQGVKEK